MRASLPLLLTCLGLVFASRPARAAGQPYSGFRIDLRQVSRLYDTAYRDRITDVIDVDTTATMDWEHIKFGNQRYQIKTFLPTDWSTTREVVDYTVIPGYRTTFTVPRAAFFENTPMDIGDLTISQPRDYTISKILAVVFPQEVQQLFPLYRDAFAGLARAELSLIQDFSAPAPKTTPPAQ